MIEIPTRQPGEVLTSLTWQEREHGRMRAYFRMHDGRIWEAQFENIKGDAGAIRSYGLVIRSEGCRPFAWLTDIANIPARISLRFANMSQHSYELITHEALPTLDHPHSYKLGMCQLLWDENDDMIINRRMPCHIDMANNKVYLFMSDQEVLEMMDAIAADPEPVSAILQSPGADQGVVLGGRTGIGWIPGTALQSFKDAIKEQMFTGSNLPAREIRPREREERMIDLGERDVEPTSEL